MKSVDSGNGNSLIPWRRKFSWWTGNLRKKIWAKFFFFRTLLMCKICFFVSFLYRVTHKGPCQTVFHLNSLQVPKTRNNKKRMKKSVKSSLKSRPLCVTLCKNTLPPLFNVHTHPLFFLGAYSWSIDQWKEFSSLLLSSHPSPSPFSSPVMSVRSYIFKNRRLSAELSLGEEIIIEVQPKTSSFKISSETGCFLIKCKSKSILNYLRFFSGIKGSEGNYLKALMNYLGAQKNYLGALKNYLGAPMNYLKALINYLGPPMNYL